MWRIWEGGVEGLEIVGDFQRRTPRQASISSGVRIASPLASHGARTHHQPRIHAENTIYTVAIADK